MWSCRKFCVTCKQRRHTWRSCAIGRVGNCPTTCKRIAHKLISGNVIGWPHTGVFLFYDTPWVRKMSATFSVAHAHNPKTGQTGSKPDWLIRFFGWAVDESRSGWQSLLPRPRSLQGEETLLAGYSQEWSTSNFPCNLTKNITQHRTKNFAFHSLFRWKMIILAILTTSLISIKYKCTGGSSDVRGIVSAASGSHRWHPVVSHQRFLCLATLSCGRTRSRQKAILERPLFIVRSKGEANEAAV